MAFPAPCEPANIQFLRPMATGLTARSAVLLSSSRNGGHGLANLKKVLGLQFKHHYAGEDARAAAEVTLKVEASMGRKIRMLNASQQRVFDL